MQLPWLSYRCAYFAPRRVSPLEHFFFLFIYFSLSLSYHSAPSWFVIHNRVRRCDGPSQAHVVVVVIAILIEWSRTRTLLESCLSLRARSRYRCRRGKFLSLELGLLLRRNDECRASCSLLTLRWSGVWVPRAMFNAKRSCASYVR